MIDLNGIMKKERRVAVLDLGTNVFNLLLADFLRSGVKYIRDFKYPGYIGAGGLRGGMISEKAFATADKAFEEIFKVIDECGGADEVISYGTSAIRDAKNGPDFAKHFSDRYNMRIQVISGEREAELIFKGILLSVEGGFIFDAGNALMLDIGGGSNEFIITDGKKILWKRSFPIGMARMRERFQYPDLIPDSVLNDFESFTIEALAPLWDAVEMYRPGVLIGSSGSFETFKDLLYKCDFPDTPSVKIPYEELNKLGGELIASSREERMAMHGMSPIRVDYIVMAYIFTSVVLRRSSIGEIYQSSYSLKEGAMQEAYDVWRTECVL